MLLFTPFTAIRFAMHSACKSRKIAFHAILTSRNMDCEQ